MEKIIVKKENSGKRIDKFLKEGIFLNDGITRGEIIRRIKAGDILANDKKVKPSYILRKGDVVAAKRETRNAKRNDLIPNPKIKLEIIFENENIIAINKPAGIQVHPDFHEKNNTLANALAAKFPEIKNVGDHLINSGQANLRPGIVHRLDKDTSGVIIVARNQKSFLELKRKFKDREIEKKYWAIVYGKVLKSGAVDKPLARSADYRKQIIASEKTKTKVREAVTNYKVIKKYKDYSLVEVAPRTGRMHQIRVHLASIGHPILGDKIYKLKNAEDCFKASRHLLHAKSIEFELFGEKYSFDSKLPRDFLEIMSKLDERPEKS